MAQLIREVKLPVVFQVHKEIAQNGACPASYSRYLIVVRACADYVFPKYFKAASASDLVLFRGMFLTATFSKDVGAPGAELLDFGVQQAFLPKFENEGQDTSVADAIEAAADERFMAVSIKHSGSLCTMSHSLLGAKNSISNAYTYGGALALNAHYRRLHDTEEAAAENVRTLLAAMQAERLSVSFEVVARCLGHHGQLPHGEYLVTTCISRITPDGRVEVLPWLDALKFCAAHRLPTNDVWLFGGRDSARRAREVLDAAAVAGAPTAEILESLDALVAEAPEKNVKLPGSYPHHLWQGSRLEGFVVSQGDAVAAHAELPSLAQTLSSQVVPSDHIGAPDYSLTELRPVESVLGADLTSSNASTLEEDAGPAANGKATAVNIKERTAQAAPVLAHMQGSWKALSDGSAGLSAPKTSPPAAEGARLVHALVHASVPLDGVWVRDAASGCAVVSRAALEACSAAELAAFAGTDPALEQILVTPAGSGAPPPDALRRAVAHASGSMRTGQQLRYKKKMMLCGKVVSYCMMTFIIRNGLPHLRRGRAAYLAYVSRLTSQWQLTTAQREDCVRFGAAWYAWVAAQDAAATRALQGSTYLWTAEAFVEAFLSGTLPPVVEAFQGILYLHGFDDATVARVFAALGLTQSHAVEWSNLLPELGTGLALHPLQRGLPIKGPSRARFWEKAAPYAKIVLRPVPPRAATHTESLYKQANGKTGALLKEIAPVRQWCEANGVSLEERILELDVPMWLPGDPAPPDDGGSCSSLTPMMADCGLAAAPGAEAAASEEAPCRKRCADGEALSKQQKPAAKAPDGVPAPPPAQMHALVDRVVRWVGCGVALKRDPALVVVFLSIPGLGKTTLSELVAAELEHTAHVVHVHCDTLDKAKQSSSSFWPLVAGESVTRRGDGRPTVVLADKNLLDAPQGNMAAAAAALAPCAPVLAVVLTDDRAAAADRGDGADARPPHGSRQGARDLVLPYDLPFVANAMHRVGLRESHPGGLHRNMVRSKAGGCYEVTATFAGANRGRSATDLLELARTHFPYVVALPVFRALAEPALPAELTELLTAALRISNFARSDDEHEAFPPGWEAAVGAQLMQPQVVDALQQRQLPVSTSAAALAGAIRDALAAEQDASVRHTPGVSRPARYYAVTGFDEAALSNAFQLAQTRAGVTQAPVASNLHVTVWHAAEPPAALPRAAQDLAAAVGVPIAVQVLAVDMSPTISAARVALLDAPEATYGYPAHHITLWHDPSTPPSASKLLPARVAAGEAGVHHVELDVPLMLHGRLEAFV